METGNCHLLKPHCLVKHPSFLPDAALWDRPQGKGWDRTPSAPTKPTQRSPFLPPPAAPTSATHHRHTSPPPLGPPIALVPQESKKHHFPRYIPHPSLLPSPPAPALRRSSPLMPSTCPQIPGDANVPLCRGQCVDTIWPRGLLRCPPTHRYINRLEPGLFSFVLPTALRSSTLFA